MKVVVAFLLGVALASGLWYHFARRATTRRQEAHAQELATLRERLAGAQKREPTPLAFVGVESAADVTEERTEDLRELAESELHAAREFQKEHLNAVKSTLRNLQKPLTFPAVEKAPAFAGRVTPSRDSIEWEKATLQRERNRALAQQQKLVEEREQRLMEAQLLRSTLIAYGVELRGDLRRLAKVEAPALAELRAKHQRRFRDIRAQCQP